MAESHKQAAPEKKRSPWRYAILIPFIGGISALVAVVTGPVAIVAVPAVDLALLGAVAYDIRKERQQARAAAEGSRQDEGGSPEG